MLFLALVLILAAAFLHAGWNVLAKVSKDTFALMWWASLLGTVAYGAWLLSTSSISIFSVSDKIAVAATPPLTYIWWVIAGDTILWLPIVSRRSRLRTNLDELRGNCRRVIATSIAMTTAYAAALTALTLTRGGYVVAGRGFSVVIGAAVGAFLLKESFGSSRITGAPIMVTGLALIAFS